MNGIAKMAHGLMSLAYPSACAVCKKGLGDDDRFGVCENCIADIKPSTRLPEVDPAQFDFSAGFSACRYDGTLKELIHSFKYGRKIKLAKLFSGILSDFVSERPYIMEGIDVITYVPLHPNRLRDREFNQSKLLVCGISGYFALPVEDLLEKPAVTAHQNELPREDRLTNLAGAFRVKGGAAVAGRRILLVDDVMTTGSTLNECAKTLAAAGSTEVRCLTLSRGI